MPLNAMLDHYIATYKSTAGRRSFVISSHNCTHYNANFMMLEFEMQHSVELLDSFDFGPANDNIDGSPQVMEATKLYLEFFTLKAVSSARVQ